MFACVCVALLGACGRLGFNSHSQDSTGSAQGDPDNPFPSGDGDDGAPAGDGDSAESPLDDGGMAALDAGTPAQGHDDAGSPLLEDGAVESDAGLPDAGLPDAGSIDPPPPVPYPLPTLVDCASVSSVLACDNLSGGTRGASVYHDQELGNVAYEDGFVTAYASQESGRAVLQTDIDARSSGNIYLRFSLYVPGDLDVLGLNIANIGVPDTGGDFGLDLNLERGGEVEIYTTGDDAVVAAGAYKVPRDRWMCVLLKVEGISDTSGTVRVRIDGQDILTSSGRDTLPQGGVVGAAAGVDWTYDGQGETTIYVSNFLLTTQHPGDCP
jgi:hypothetical protein